MDNKHQQDTKKAGKPKPPPRKKQNQEETKADSAQANSGEPPKKFEGNLEKSYKTEKGQGKGGKTYKGKKIYKEKINVTIDTEIPALPKKDERLKQPDDEAYHKRLDDIATQIDQLYKKMSDVAREVKSKEFKDAGDSRYDDLNKLLKVKQEERSKAYEEFQAANIEKDQYKKGLEDYYEKSNKYRYQMKVAGSKEELEAKLKELQGRQSSGSISLTEEKALIKEISDIKQSLPYAQPLSDLNEEYGDIKKKSKAAKEVTSKKYEVFTRLRDECKDIQDQINKLNEEHAAKKKETTPAIQSMKDKYREEINALKEKRKELGAKHKEAWNKFNEQNFEIDRIKYMQKIKNRLLAEEARKQRQIEWEKKKKEREEARKETPYLNEIELCNQLVTYCQKLVPHKDDTVVVDDAATKESVDAALKSNEWKNQKAEFMLSKKDDNNDFFVGKKKGKKAKKPVEEKKDEKIHALQHQIDALKYFEEVKVSPPLTTDKLEDTIKVLNEKKDYFKKLQEDAIKAEEEKEKKKKENPEGEANGEDKKEEAAKEEKKEDSPSKPKKEKSNKNKPEKIDVANENEFPSF